MLDPWEEWLLLEPQPASRREAELAALMGRYRWGWLYMLTDESNQDFWITGTGISVAEATDHLKRGLGLLVDGVLSENRTRIQEGLRSLCAGLALLPPGDALTLRVWLSPEKLTAADRPEGPELVPGLSDQVTLWLRLLLLSATDPFSAPRPAFAAGDRVQYRHPSWGLACGQVLRVGGERGPGDARTLLVNDLGPSGAREWWPVAECWRAP